MRSRRVLLVLCVFVPAWVQGPPASACSCAPRSYAYLYDAADAVFIGTALAVEEADGLATATFEVDRVDKGTAVVRQDVRTASGGATCGVRFEPRVRYRVYARDLDGSLHASLCGGTRAVGHADPPDTRPPRTAIDGADRIGARVSGTAADDLSGIWAIEVTAERAGLRDEPVRLATTGSCADPPVACSWETTLPGPGVWSVSAAAEDAWGNVGGDVRATVVALSLP